MLNFTNNDLIQLFCKEVMYPLIPMWKESFMAEYIDSELEKKSIGLGDYGMNENNVKSPYYYKGVYRFVHYTSLQNCINIIKDKKFRLYSLLSMDDIEEFSYASEEFGVKLNDYENDELKERIFSLSLASYKDEINKENLDLWRAYAQDGRGVGIVFSINKRQAKSWVGYALSKVYYKGSHLERYKKVRERYKEFQKKYNTEIQNFESLFYSYLSFHKTNLYKNEKEIRLLYSLNGSSNFSSKDLNVNGKIRNFIELDIESKNEGEPNIKIDEILLGYRLEDSSWNSMQNVISQYLDNHENRIKINFSVLKTHFNKDEKR